LKLQALKVRSLDCCYRRRFAHCDTCRVTRAESQSRRIFNPTEILPYVAFNKDAFPNRQRTSPAGSNHSACQNKPILLNAGVFRVIFQAQYQAFVRFAVGSSAALSAIALNWTCVLEPFTPGGLSF
jgi:hypothetical protein